MTSRAPLLALLSLAFLVVGCSGDDDGPADSGTRDAGPGGDRDGGVRDGGDVVVGCNNPALTPPGNGTCAHAAGTNGALLIRGDVAAPEGLLQNGHVLVGANGQIKCAACDCSSDPDFAAASVLECAKGLVSPALINAHDHITFTETPPTPPSDMQQRYDHRHDWRRGGPGFERIPSVGNRGGNDGVLWGELRQLMGGATSVNGSGGANGLLRNLDRSGAQQEGLDQASVDYSTFPLGDTGGERRDNNCMYPRIDSPTSNAFMNAIAYAPHIAEGIDISARNEFLCLSGLQMGGEDVLLAKTAVIHGIGLLPSDFGAMAGEGASLIWSPRSNISLYGHTAQVVLAKRSGVNIALGTDWTATGSMNVVRELRCAQDFNRNNLGGFFTDRELFQMVTVNAATALGSASRIGSLTPGREGDITIFNNAVNKGYLAVVNADPEDVVLVLRSGKVLYGDAEIVAALPSGDTGCETVDVCGVNKRACVQRETGSEIATIRAALPDYTYDLFFCDTPPMEPTCIPFRVGEFMGVPMPGDADGDGVVDAMDNCTDVFNPVRPLDQSGQSDVDDDMVGDACDACPLDPGTTGCAPPNPNDVDGDTIPNGSDNCPSMPNMDQADRDNDMIGDVCDACPDESNAGGAACSSTIYEIKQRNVTGGRVRLVNVLVTAVTSNGYYAQTIEGDDTYDTTLGANFSGVFVFAGTDAPKPARADRVTIDGEVSDFFGQAQLSNSSFTVITSGQPLPDPVLATPAEVATGGTRAAQLEGVLVEVRNVTVTELEPPAGAGDTAPTNEFVVDGSLRVNDNIFLLSPLPQVGENISFIVGILRLANENSKLEPRDIVDYGVPPALLGFVPAQKFIRSGSTGVPAGGYTIALTRPALTPITVSLSADAGVVVPASVMMAMGEGAADISVDVTSIVGTTATITASYDNGTVVQTVNGMITVYDDAAPRSIAALSLLAVTVTTNAMTDGMVAINLPGAVGGTAVTFTVTPSGLATVAPVTIPEAALSSAIVLTTNTSTGAGMLTAMAGGTTRSFSFEVIDASTVPVVINELLYDSVGGDTGNVFTELYGPPNLDLTGWTLEGINGSNGSSYMTVSLTGAIIPADGYLVIAESSANATLAPLVDFTGTVDWQNGPDTLLLKDSSGMTVDALQYGDASGNNMGEGTPAPDVAAGSSLTRDGSHTDTDDNVTDFTESAVPTPGS